MTNFLKDMKIE